MCALYVRKNESTAVLCNIYIIQVIAGRHNRRMYYTRRSVGDGCIGTEMHIYIYIRQVLNRQ